MEAEVARGVAKVAMIGMSSVLSKLTNGAMKAAQLSRDGGSFICCVSGTGIGDGSSRALAAVVTNADAAMAARVATTYSSAPVLSTCSELHLKLRRRS
eukprot:6213551-Pleurochrysis_carterae.AAC.1